MQWKAGFTTTGSEIEPSTGLHWECESTAVLQLTIGSFSNDDCDGNEVVKKAIGLLRKTTTLHVHHDFLYISLLSLHDYDVKMPNYKFYVQGRKQATTKLFFFP